MGAANSMLARIIAVTELKPGIHSKFARRLEHVRTTLIPSLRSIGLDPDIFPAILGREVPKVSDGSYVFDGKTIRMDHGCIGNLMSNYSLWKLCVDSGEPLLILEDDAILPEANSWAVRYALEDFLKVSNENDILYLLGKNPSLKDAVKRYSESEICRINGHLARVVSTGDLSCTAAYCVRHESAMVLIDRIDKTLARATDGYVHTAQREGVIGVVVQTEPTNGFMLNDNWAEWNHRHDPSVVQ